MTRLARRALALVSIVGGLVGVASPALADPADPGPTTTPSSPITSSSSPASPPPTVPTPSTVPVPDQVPVLTGRAGDLPSPPDAGAAPGAATVTDLGGSVVRTGLSSDPSASPGGPTSSPTTGPDAAAPGAPRSGHDSGGAPASQPPSGAGSPSTGARPSTAGNPPAGAAAGASPFPPAATTYVVAPGDNLWTVSAAHLAAMTDQPAGAVPDGAVTAYWERVCAMNQARLLSGNVNVIFPGEQIELPPLGA